MAGFGRTKGLDSNIWGVGEWENMANGDGERSRADALASHGHHRLRDLRDTFPFDKEECHRMGGFVQCTFTRHAAHGE